MSTQAQIRQSLPWKVPPFVLWPEKSGDQRSKQRLKLGVLCVPPLLYLSLLLSQTLNQTCLPGEAFLASLSFPLLHVPLSACASGQPALPGTCHRPETLHNFACPFTLHLSTELPDSTHPASSMPVPRQGAGKPLTTSSSPQKKTPDLLVCQFAISTLWWPTSTCHRDVPEAGKRCTTAPFIERFHHAGERDENSPKSTHNSKMQWSN